MKPLFFSLCLAALGGLFTSATASANGPGGYAGVGNMGYPFMPFGFYQPYGAHYGTALQTPPYFALNPPVYYGKRFARPYGLSPFAAPPMMDAPADYRGRAATSFVRPPASNPYIIDHCTGSCTSTKTKSEAKLANGGTSPSKIGEVVLNPFVNDTEAARVAQR